MVMHIMVTSMHRMFVQRCIIYCSFATVAEFYIISHLHRGGTTLVLYVFRTSLESLKKKGLKSMVWWRCSGKMIPMVDGCADSTFSCDLCKNSASMFVQALYLLPYFCYCRNCHKKNHPQRDLLRCILAKVVLT